MYTCTMYIGLLYRLLYRLKYLKLVSFKNIFIFIYTFCQCSLVGSFLYWPYFRNKYILSISLVIVVSPIGLRISHIWVNFLNGHGTHASNRKKSINDLLMRFWLHVSHIDLFCHAGNDCIINDSWWWNK